MAQGFAPNFVPYLHDDNKIRPAVLVVPGGGYTFVSASEGEIVADKFWDKGYTTFVLTYTVDPLMDEPLGTQPLHDISRAMRMIRKNAAAYHIDPEHITICGFSAGGHLCADLCVHFAEDEETNAAYKAFSNRPDSAVLSYPVITSGTYAHQGSFQARYGLSIYEKAENGDADAQELLHHASLETQVTDTTPPCFLWHTATDGLVPMQNSLLFAAALAKENIPMAIHIFSKGNHGLSVANSEWAHGRVGRPYCQEQTECVAAALREGKIDMPEKQKEEFLFWVHEPTREELAMNIPNPEVAVWPDLADDWLHALK